MFRFPTSPIPEKDGSFRPSWLAMKLATSASTDFDGTVFENAYEGCDRKILMVATEEKNMTMKNGKIFSTGNHPVEMLVPMLHLTNAGFTIEVVTLTGRPVQIEMWAMPGKDVAVNSAYDKFKDQFDHPRSITDFVQHSMNETSPYVAVFLPGGHGAMLGLPDSPELGEVIKWCFHRDLHMLALCHGPAALLAAGPRTSNEPFVYSGYEMAAFPDAVDRQTPMIGYMPGHMPWHHGEELRELGVCIVNTKANGATHVDRKLISGDSPKAANEFGKLAATELLKQVRQ